MHTQRPYRVRDERKLLNVVRKHGLGTLVSARDGEVPRATLVPLLLRRDQAGRERLWSHMGREPPVA